MCTSEPKQCPVAMAAHGGAARVAVLPTGTGLPMPFQDIVDGVVFRNTGLDRDDVDWVLWKRLADLLIPHLGDYNPSVHNRIHTYYLPIFFYLDHIRRRSSPLRNTAVVGVSCPQGGGKTTLTAAMRFCFRAAGHRCVIASTDDFYLTRDQQVQLSEKHKGNPLLELRGNPGSIDVQLMLDTIVSLTNLPEGQNTMVTRYDKSLFQGKGDRAAVQDFEQVEGPIDIVLVEGWCIGFRPVAAQDLITDYMKPVNEYLAEFSRLYDMLDALLVIEVEDPSCVYDWREQAEAQMKASGKPGMNEDELKDFVDRFMPSYKQYLPGLYSTRLASHELRIRISPQRVPVDSFPAQPGKL